MRIDVITLFPEILEGSVPHSILGRAQKTGALNLCLHQLRDYALDKHRTVDDRPYGGGPGMVLRCEPVFRAVETVREMVRPTGKVIYLSPAGRKLDQACVRELCGEERLILLCGHYEGMDQRVCDHLVDEEISIGDYVLSNGAVAALVVIDAVVRLSPGVLGNEESAGNDSFSEGVLEGPQYTRPEMFREWGVPEILLSGHHAQIQAWRREQGRLKTGKRRPDLLEERKGNV